MFSNPLHKPSAPQLKLLPEELNQILIITVVFSMAHTPALAALGSKLGDAVDALEASSGSFDEERAAPKNLEVCRIHQACFQGYIPTKLCLRVLGVLAVWLTVLGVRLHVLFVVHRLTTRS
jgi:hypothetical protein